MILIVYNARRKGVRGKERPRREGRGKRERERFKERERKIQRERERERDGVEKINISCIDRSGPTEKG